MQCFGAAHQERVEDEIESEVGWKTGEAVLLKRNGRVKRRLVREELGPRHTLRKHSFLVPGSEASFPLNGGEVNWRRESLPLKSGARSYPRLLVALGADSAELDQFRGVTLDSGRTVTRAGSPASTLAAIARSRRRHGEGLAARGAIEIRIRVCLQAYRKCRVMRAPLGRWLWALEFHHRPARAIAFGRHRTDYCRRRPRSTRRR